MNVDTAFLCGDLEEEIFMEIPKVYKAPAGKCLWLRKCIFGLVQASRIWFLKFANFLRKNLHFTQSKADPCILYREDDSGTCYGSIYIDDTLLVGDAAAVDKACAEISQEFSVKLQNSVTEYLGCEFFLIYRPW